MSDASVPPRTREARPAETAADRFRRSYGKLLGLGLLLSLCVHAGVVLLSPRITFPTEGLDRASLRVLDLPPDRESPPEVSVPAAPQEIPPPSSPVLTEGPAEVRARPVFIPHDVPPRLENLEEIRSFLTRFYPPTLRELGVEAEVVVWLFVNERGDVVRSLVRAPSGIEAFDRLARTVGSWMEFRPAYSQDRPIGVWVAQPIRFEVERREDTVTRVASGGSEEE